MEDVTPWKAHAGADFMDLWTHGKLTPEKVKPYCMQWEGLLTVPGEEHKLEEAAETKLMVTSIPHAPVLLGREEGMAR